MTYTYMSRHQIKHVDLFYEDGGNPTESILQSFLHLCETHEGAIAVHCKAGLGRTGTNICAYMVKHLGYVYDSIHLQRLIMVGLLLGVSLLDCSIVNSCVCLPYEYMSPLEASSCLSPLPACLNLSPQYQLTNSHINQFHLSFQSYIISNTFT